MIEYVQRATGDVQRRCDAPPGSVARRTLHVARLFATTISVLAAAAQSPPRTVWDQVYTAEQAKRGQAIYSAQCAACHGVMLDGIDAAPALTGGGFLGRWDGVNLGDMVERIRVSMPLSNPGSLGRRQVVDVLSYILSVNGMPPGDAELPAEPPRLSQIVFRAAKPHFDGP
jgi:mono/diheme cytochrome c family protein